MIFAIASGYLVAVVVLIVERTNAKENERKAFRRGVEAGYHRCLSMDEAAKTLRRGDLVNPSATLEP